MRLLLLKICVGAMYYFIIACSQLQVSGEFPQPKPLEQESVIRPGYYSYEIEKTENRSRPNEEVEKYAPKKCNDSLKSPSVNIFEILHKLVSKSGSLQGKQNLLKVVLESRKMTGRVRSLNNLKKQGIYENVDEGRGIGFGNYLVRTIQQSDTTTTPIPETNLSSPSKKIRKIRNIFPSLTNFKDLQDAIKSTAYFGLHKDGNLSSFEHFDFHTNTHNFSNATQEESRLTRSNMEAEDLTKKKTAVSNFLLELQDALETIKFLTDGMFYPQMEESDEVLYNLTAKNATSDGEEITRKIRQLSEEVDVDEHKMSHFITKLIEMEKTLNQLTESIAKNGCNCLVKESCGLKRKLRETKRENCRNCDEVSIFAKNLNSLLRDFVDTSVGDFRKSGAFIKLKKFRSELTKLRKQLGNTQ